MQDTPATHIIAYHVRTKHHARRFARGPGGLDWSNQPNPFRRFSGAPLYRLPLASGDETPPAGTLFGAGPWPAPRRLDLGAIGLFFELSLALSARKEAGASSWFLRINPSSGNLHPTEGYALLPAIEGLSGGAGLYHYAPHAHALEHRARWIGSEVFPGPGFWVGLTSIVWREAWKYGERAFRYCQHDVGHALGALRFAAATLGWQLQMIPELTDEQLAELLGVDRQEDFAGAEREVPELLAWVSAGPAGEQAGLPPGTSRNWEWSGQANRLSPEHVEWPVLDQAVTATRREPRSPSADRFRAPTSWSPPAPPPGPFSAGQLIRRRRSAVSFDGASFLSREGFLSILDTTLPRESAPPFDVWPFPPELHLVLMVHRVTGLEPGLYLLVRAPGQLEDLRHDLRAELDWETEAAGTLPLYRLARGDTSDFARTVSCEQDIAADGVFSLGMLARFEPVVDRCGAVAYRELFWEAGLMGQALYLAAEAAGVRGTGIGCYLDDEMHRALGLTGHGWQSLYHFTVGHPLEDARLRTASPYGHLSDPAGGRAPPPISSRPTETARWD